MTFTALSPMLWTDRLEETIDFYTRNLKFSCVEKNEDWGWASLQRDGIGIMLAKPNAQTPLHKPLFSRSLYIKTDQLNELWETLHTKAWVNYPIWNFDWGMMEFAIYDNNGYPIQFGQELED